MIPSLHRRRARSRFEVEALESRYVLDATLGAVAPIFLSFRADVQRPTPADFQISFQTGLEAPSRSVGSPGSLSPIESVGSIGLSLEPPALFLPAHTIGDVLTGGIFSPSDLIAETDIDIRVNFGNPFNSFNSFDAPRGISALAVLSYSTGLETPTRSVGSAGSLSPIEESVTSIGLSLESPASPSTHMNGSAPGLEQQPTSPASATNAIRSEEAATPLGSSRSDAAAVAASAAARRTDSVVAAGLPVDRRLDRPTPTAFATNLEIDAVRREIDPNRPLPSPAELTAPRFNGPAEPPASIESTSQRPPTEQARDAVFAGLFVDGFAPQLLDHAFRALKSVETNLDSTGGTGWYRTALGCWVVAAVLAYEAARQTQASNARTLRYATTASLEEPEDER